MTDTLPDHYVHIHNHGFVGLVDYMGSDAAVVEAARVSYNKSTTIKRSDVGLINYLMRNRHTSPFEMCEVKFHVRAPIFILRQWVRHRTANWNEESGRYGVMQEEFYIPETEVIEGQHATNKQSRGEALDVGVRLSAKNLISSSNKASFEIYDYLLESKVAREVSRTVLPLGTYASIYWKTDLHNLLHFLKLRTDSHAQQEIRDYADIIHQLAEPLFPDVFAAWENYVRYAVTFSRDEIEAIRKSLTQTDIATFVDNLPGNMSANEREDFKRKLGYDES
jgi:thymidylate synthase (FAD)